MKFMYALRLMVDNLELCGLEKAGSHESGSFDIISGDQVIFSVTEGFMGSIRMVLRYGMWTLMKLEKFVENLLNSFSTIYDKLDNGLGYETVEKLLDEMGPMSKSGQSSHEMNLLTKVSIADKLRGLSMSDEFINELAMIAMKVNYNQFPENIHAFVGAVSLAGIQDGLWRVRGGNYRIPECLLKKSSSTLLPSRVDTIKPNKEGRYDLSYDNIVEAFDIVVVATPLTEDKTNLKLVGPQGILHFPGNYQRTLAYLVHGSLNMSSFEVHDDSGTENFFMIDRNDPISSLSRLTPVDFKPDVEVETPEVYKVFSRVELIDADFAKYFAQVHSKMLVDWLAYPQYKSAQDMESFVLQNNLYYLNAIEWSASAMEMSALAAKNVANLISTKLNGNVKEKLGSEEKIEL